MKPQTFFLIVALAVGFALVVVTPPFQAPDETGHFFRAYHISEGTLNARRVNGLRGGYLPFGIAELAQRFGPIAHQSEAKTSASAIWDSREIRLDGRPRVFLSFAGAAGYLPISYAPQSLAIGVSRALSDRPVDHLFAARLANLLVGVGLCFAAIRIAPFFRWVLTLLALMPMTIFLRSSASPDATIIGLALLVFALALRLLSRQQTSDFALLTFGTAVLALLKPYGQLAFIALMRRSAWKRPWLIWSVGICGLIAIACITLAWYANRYYPTPHPAINPQRQLEVVVHDPIHFLKIATRDYAIHTPRYARQFVGHLGWLDTHLPLWLLAMVAAALVASALTDGSGVMSLSLSQRLAIALLVAITALTISLSQYLTWTGVGANQILGVQGRYFIPIAPAALLVFSTRRLARSEKNAALPIMFMAVALVASAVTLWSLVMRYYAV